MPRRMPDPECRQRRICLNILVAGGQLRTRMPMARSLALQKDGVEDAAQMSKQPNHYDNPPVVLVISVEVSVSIISLRSYSADY
jgi:hypothetical protein